MPISEKITKELSKLPISKDEKKLMEQILIHEDVGTAHYANLYERLIKDYIEKNPPKKGGRRK